VLFLYGTFGGRAPEPLAPPEAIEAPVQSVQIVTAPAEPIQPGEGRDGPVAQSEADQSAVPLEGEPEPPVAKASPDQNEWKTAQQVTVQIPAAVTAPEPVEAAGPAAVPVALPDQTPVPASAPEPAVSKAKITKNSIAKYLFGAVKQPANLATRSIGFYAHGCLAGGQLLPVNGPAWQVMRLSRNRNWGHPTLIQYIERFAQDAKEKDGWPGLLIGDLSMPRGGPMPFGHASHQVGLDVDIWYEPEPQRELTPEERENKKMESFLLDPGHVNPAVWKPEYEKLLRRAVSYPEVARIFVNPAIKKWLCDNAKGDRTFLHKITPIMGHDDHFHVRLVCPPNNPGCEGQVLKATDEGCGKGLDQWIASLTKQKLAPTPPVSPVPAMSPAQAAALADAPKSPSVKPHLPYHGLAAKIQSWQRKAAALRSKRNLTMAQLPAECETVLKAPPAPVTAAASALGQQTR